MKHFFIALVACMLSVLMMRADEVKVLEIELTEAGTLAQKLEDITLFPDVEDLVVRGPMNVDDCHLLITLSQQYETLFWEAFDRGDVDEYMALSVNIKDAHFADNKIPDMAFLPLIDGEYNALTLHRFDIPDYIAEVGFKAFSGCTVGCGIKYPEGITRLNEYSFAGSTIYGFFNSLADGLTEIPDFCFNDFWPISETDGIYDLHIPSTVKRIGREAFSSHLGYFTSITFNEGLEEIGDWAFKEDNPVYMPQLVIPSTCLQIGTGAFWNLAIGEIILPDGLSEITPRLFQRDVDDYGVLNKIHLPRGLRVIGDMAFSRTFRKHSNGSVEALKYLEIPEGVHYIGIEAFADAGFETFKFPSTTKTVGCGCLKNAVTGDILIAAASPPECLPNDYSNSEPIFQGLEDHILYVPEGAAEAYRQAYGWSEFTDIREDPNLKDSSVTELVLAEENAPVYDVQGRQVSDPQTGKIYIMNGRKVIFR